VYSQEVLEDEAPKYLRRQKPAEAKNRKFGGKAWKTYFRVSFWAAAGLASAGIAYGCTNFLLNSKEMALVHPEQVELSGNHNVSRASVLDIFRGDRGRSVVRIPLDDRRRQIEALPWVEQATVRRALPHTLQVEIVERSPIAFLRDGPDMALVDAHGVILERPLQGKFHFPVVTGITVETPLEERERRMQLFAGFIQQISSARPGAAEQVSDVDLSDAHDLRASITGLQSAGDPRVRSAAGNGGAGESWGDSDAPVLVHFGESDFETKYQTLIEKMGQWRATAGRVESVDMRFEGQAVVNSDTPAVARVVKPAVPGHKTQRPAR
jgi:cell division protein FtsQ